MVSALIVLVVPYEPIAGLEDFFGFHAINVGVLYAIIIGFIMSLSLSRKHELMEYILLELNKLRRMHHIALHLSKADASLQIWFTLVRDRIREYLGLFRHMPFHDYANGNAVFRRLTYTIYDLPQQSAAYNHQLYEALLEAAGSATEAREHIRAKKDDDIGYFQWGVILFVAIVFSVIIAAGTPLETYHRTVSGIVIFCLFLALQLIYEYDQSNDKKQSYLTGLYLQNLENIEKAMVVDARGRKEG
jgi:hypothetical protein